MRKPRIPPFWAGVLAMLAVSVGTLAAIATSPRLTDGLMWRLERVQGQPTPAQRIFERRLTAHQLSQDRLVPPGAALFFGDSHLQTLPMGGLPQAYNFAIGGESAQRLSDRMARYGALATARAVVIGAGTNDLHEGRSPVDVSRAWLAMLEQVPRGARVVCVGLPWRRDPSLLSDNQAEANRQIESLCRERGHTMISVIPGEGAWAGTAFAADGVHLDAAGAQRLLERIAVALKEAA